MVKFGVWSFSLEKIVRMPSDLMHPLLTRIMIASDSSLGGLHKIKKEVPHGCHWFMPYIVESFVDHTTLNAVYHH